jgi:hypothetical protein
MGDLVLVLFGYGGVRGVAVFLVCRLRVLRGVIRGG